MRKQALTLWLLLAAPVVLAHSQHDVTRYVASDGADSGQCDDATAPCSTIAYAASRAGKGDRVLVASGRYGVGSADELFYVLSGIVRLEGGYSRAERFGRQAPAEFPTLLMGVPLQLRERMELAGFQVIVDSKGLDAHAQQAMEVAGRSIALMERSVGPASCSGGNAGGFPCTKADLLSHVALTDFSSAPAAGNDIWGFLDLNTEREYAIIGLANGTAFVDVTDPAAPFEVGIVEGGSSTWRDIRVYQRYDPGTASWHAFAYVTTDAQTDKLAVIDLSGLPNHVALAARRTPETRAHTLYIGNVDYSTGIPSDGLEPVVFTAGSNLSGGGFRAYSVTDAPRPELLVSSPTQHYTHDATALTVTDARKDTQCVHATEFCSVYVDYNETTVDLWDYTDIRNPRELSSTTYPNASFVHSGWPTEDGAYVFVQDELDEMNVGLHSTVRVFSLANLDAPALAGTWTGPTTAIDHNGYVRGNRYYMSNYTRGLTVLDITDPTAPVSVASFDTYVPTDATSFNGAWGTYPFLPSGSVLVSDINSGLYVVRDRSLEQSHGSLTFATRTGGGVENDVVPVVVERVGGASGAVSVAYETMSAAADHTNYEPQSGRLSWAAGDASSRTLNVHLIPNGIEEGPRRFFVRLFDPKGGATLLSPSMTSVFVSNPGATTELAFAEPIYVTRNGAERAMLVVRRLGSAQGAAAVSYRTIAGTALPGVQYAEVAAGELSWPDGDATGRTITIDLMPSAADRERATFSVALFDPHGATLDPNADADEAIVEIADRVPTARAGADQTVGAGELVTLTALDSTDPEGEFLAYSWREVDGPEVVLTDGVGAGTSFNAPDVTSATNLQFLVTVTDVAGNQSTDSVIVTVSAPAGGGGGGDGGSGGGGGGALAPLDLLFLIVLGAARRRLRGQPERAGHGARALVRTP
jgi:choice-of-anchor B domain-containing protein